MCKPETTTDVAGDQNAKAICSKFIGKPRESEECQHVKCTTDEDATVETVTCVKVSRNIGKNGKGRTIRSSEVNTD